MPLAPRLVVFQATKAIDCEDGENRVIGKRPIGGRTAKRSVNTRVPWNNYATILRSNAGSYTVIALC